MPCRVFFCFEVPKSHWRKISWQIAPGCLQFLFLSLEVHQSYWRVSHLQNIEGGGGVGGGFFFFSFSFSLLVLVLIAALLTQEAIMRFHQARVM